MPEFDGLEIERLLGIRGLSDELRRGGDASKLFGESIEGSDRQLRSMIDTLERSKYSFGEFIALWEKTNVVVGASTRLFNDLSMNMRGMVTSAEGLISSLNTLGTRTLPELTYSLGMAASGYKKQMEGLKEDITARQSAVAHYTELANAIEENGSEADKAGGRVEGLRNRAVELQVELEDLQEKFNDTGAAAELLGKSLNKALGIFALVVGALTAISGAYDTTIKASREVIYTMSRLGVSYKDASWAVDEFNESFTKTSNKWGMLREEMAKAVAPLASLGVGVGAGGAAASIEQIRNTLITAADITGGMMRGFGIEAGITTKALGTLSTTFNLQGDSLGSAFARLATAGEKSVLGMQRYITETTGMIEATRRYGGSQEQAMIMTTAFGEEVKKGTISMENLAKFTTPAMWSMEQQGAVASMMTRYSPNAAKDLEMTGGNGLNDIYALQKNAADHPEALMQGMQDIFKKIVPANAGEGEQAILKKSLLEQLTGTQISTLEAVNTFLDPEKMKKIFSEKTSWQDEAQGTYNLIKTHAERTAVATEAIRNMIDMRWGSKHGMKSVTDTPLSEEGQRFSAAMKKPLPGQPGFLKEYGIDMSGMTFNVNLNEQSNIDEQINKACEDWSIMLKDWYKQQQLNPQG